MRKIDVYKYLTIKAEKEEEEEKKCLFYLHLKKAKKRIEKFSFFFLMDCDEKTAQN